MNMIDIMVSFSDFYIIRFTYTFKDVFKSNRYLIIDYFSSVLNDQYKMIVQNNDSFETEEE